MSLGFVKSLRFAPALALGFFAGAIAFMRFVNPSTTPWFPRCFWRDVTGLECPGCGTGRSLRAIAEGRFGDVLSLNPMFYVILLFLIVAVIWPRVLTLKYTPHVVGIVTVAWWIGRNVI